MHSAHRIKCILIKNISLILQFHTLKYKSQEWLFHHSSWLKLKFSSWLKLNRRWYKWFEEISSKERKSFIITLKALSSKKILQCVNHIWAFLKIILIVLLLKDWIRVTKCIFWVWFQLGMCHSVFTLKFCGSDCPAHCSKYVLYCYF